MYSALIVWLPTVIDESAIDAWPVASTGTSPSGVAPSENLTVPGGTSVPAASTNAVKVTVWPYTVGLGCDVRHADRLVYAAGRDLDDRDAAVPIGVGCKVCDRDGCPQRAFPQIGRSLAIDENRSTFAPYPLGTH